MLLAYGGFFMEEEETDKSNKNVVNPDFLWDLDGLGQELRAAFLDASKDLYEDIENLEEQILGNLEKEDEE